MIRNNHMRRSACLVINPIAVNKVEVLLNFTQVGQASDYNGTYIKLHVFILVQLLLFSGVV